MLNFWLKFILNGLGNVIVLFDEIFFEFLFKFIFGGKVGGGFFVLFFVFWWGEFDDGDFVDVCELIGDILVEIVEFEFDGLVGRGGVVVIGRGGRGGGIVGEMGRFENVGFEFWIISFEGVMFGFFFIFCFFIVFEMGFCFFEWVMILFIFFVLVFFVILLDSKLFDDFFVNIIFLFVLWIIDFEFFLVLLRLILLEEDGGIGKFVVNFLNGFLDKVGGLGDILVFWVFILFFLNSKDDRGVENFSLLSNWWLVGVWVFFLGILGVLFSWGFLGLVFCEISCLLCVEDILDILLEDFIIDVGVNVLLKVEELNCELLLFLVILLKVLF